ncbi:ankyrin repeat domain-containing protein [Wolbachia endosymbiont of Chironomus riparius]|uniref:ankyrin repeat domain-containing protein n=1 Tax=Wolbachia endosymbiont of Chironomus riparius TaxID=2883238 RepID=UPI00209CB765|nr:ankyrin repeat domain-containing protein [Wolbachia endosymbiont of Chironomus riparius]
MNELIEALKEVNNFQNLNENNIINEIEKRFKENFLSKNTLTSINFIEFRKWKNHELNIDHKFSAEEYTLLHIAIKVCCEKVLELLIAKKANINIQDANGYTPLYLAIENGYIDIATFLINVGAKVNIECGHSKSTALHLAAKKGHQSIITHLLEKRSNPNALNRYGQIPLHFAAKYNNTDSAVLLILNGANVNIQDYKNRYTPLYFAILKNNVKLANILLESGTDIDIQDRCKRNLLHFTIKEKKWEIVEIFLKQKVNVNAQDEGGCAPLHYAVYLKNLHTVTNLLKYEAKINIQDKNGQTALNYAWSDVDKSPELVKLLLNYGADFSYIHKPKAQEVGIISSYLAAVVTTILIWTTQNFLPKVITSVEIGIMITSFTFIVGVIAYGIAYKISKYEVNSKLSEVNITPHSTKHQLSV